VLKELLKEVEAGSEPGAGTEMAMNLITVRVHVIGTLRDMELGLGLQGIPWVMAASDITDNTSE
jgi:hypothetical protein